MKISHMTVLVPTDCETSKLPQYHEVTWHEFHMPLCFIIGLRLMHEVDVALRKGISERYLGHKPWGSSNMTSP
jgi:hypothetical protein